MFEELKQRLRHVLFTKKLQLNFLEDISTLVEDGVPIREAVDTIRQINTGISKDMASSVLQRIAEGKSFADSLKDWFTEAVVEIIRAGEEGGTLTETMRSAARALSQESKTVSSLVASTLYPLTVIVMALAVCVFINHSVFLNFAQIKPISTWPSNGQNLAYLASFLQSWWWLVALIIIGVIFAVTNVLRNLTGELRKAIDDIPPFSIYRSTVAARFMEILGLLIANGITFKKAFYIIRQNATPYLSWHLAAMQSRLSGGKENIAEVIDTGLINHADILRLKAIARSKGFEHALIRMGKQTMDRNAKTVQVAGKIIGGILLGVGAAFAAYMIFAIYNVGSFVGT